MAGLRDVSGYLGQFVHSVQHPGSLIVSPMTGDVSVVIILAISIDIIKETTTTPASIYVSARRPNRPTHVYIQSATQTGRVMH